MTVQLVHYVLLTLNRNWWHLSKCFGLLKYDLKLETWKVDPFLYQILMKNETRFYTRTTNFKQNFLKMSYYFPKLLSFQAYFAYIRLMKLGLFLSQFKKILKIWPMFIPVFALNKGSSLYQEADFETHFSSTSPDRPLYLEPRGGGTHLNKNFARFCTKFYVQTFF